MKNLMIYKILTIFSGVMLLAATIFVLVKWQQLPDQIPVHYNFAGEADDYGGRNALIWELCLAWGIWLLFTIIEKFPRLWNFPVTVTAENKGRLIRITRIMMQLIKLLTAGLFSVTIIAAAMSRDLGAWVVMVFLMAITAVTGIGILLMIRNR